MLLAESEQWHFEFQESQMYFGVLHRIEDAGGALALYGERCDKEGNIERAELFRFTPPGFSGHDEGVVDLSIRAEWMMRVPVIDYEWLEQQVNKMITMFVVPQDAAWPYNAFVFVVKDDEGNIEKKVFEKRISQ